MEVGECLEQKQVVSVWVVVSVEVQLAEKQRKYFEQVVWSEVSLEVSWEEGFARQEVEVVSSEEVELLLFQELLENPSGAIS